MQRRWIVSGTAIGIGRLVRKIGRDNNLFLIPRRYDELGDQIMLFSVVIGLPIQPMSVGLLRLEGLSGNTCRLDFTNELLRTVPGPELSRLAGEYCAALSEDFEDLGLLRPQRAVDDASS